jgi:hypothetical protein
MRPDHHKKCLDDSIVVDTPSGVIAGCIAFATSWCAGRKKPEHSLAFLHVACALIAFRATGVFG